jgi:RNA polymerase sigma-70 factor (ECF subfamily)
LNNKCADWVRKQQLQSQLNSRLATQTQNYADKEQGSNEKTESLKASIEKLPTDQRALLSLRYQQDFDISEIAEILAIPEGTVKSRLHRTLAELREIMGANRNG